MRGGRGGWRADARVRAVVWVICLGDETRPHAVFDWHFPRPAVRLSENRLCTRRAKPAKSVFLARFQRFQEHPSRNFGKNLPIGSNIYTPRCKRGIPRNRYTLPQLPKGIRDFPLWHYI